MRILISEINIQFSSISLFELDTHKFCIYIYWIFVYKVIYTNNYYFLVSNERLLIVEIQIQFSICLMSWIRYHVYRH